MIYLASPYTSDDPAVMQSRYDFNVNAVAFILASGKSVYSPIVHFHPVATKHLLPRSFDFWMKQNFAILRHADELWALNLPGLADSKGVAAEQTLATQLGIPTHIVTLAGLANGTDLL